MWCNRTFTDFTFISLLILHCDVSNLFHFLWLQPQNFPFKEVTIVCECESTHMKAHIRSVVLSYVSELFEPCTCKCLIFTTVCTVSALENHELLQQDEAVMFNYDPDVLLLLLCLVMPWGVKDPGSLAKNSLTRTEPKQAGKEGGKIRHIWFHFCLFVHRPSYTRNNMLNSSPILSIIFT